MDISRLQIDQSKMLASGAEYFKLFEKHLPDGLNASETVLVYEICNLSCVKKIVSLNPEAKHVVVGSKICNRALKMLLPKSTAVEYLEEFDFKETDMKFDCIIMNPPYQRNLHLKILAEAIKHLKDEKSVCVNLSPVRWLQDPLAKWKKHCDLKRFEESVAKRIEKLDVYNGEIMSVTFDAGMPNMGIYLCRKKEYYAYLTFCKNSIFDKVYDKTKLSCPEFDKNKKTGWRVKVSPIYGGGTAGAHSKGQATMRNFGKLLVFEDGKKDNKPWYTFYAHNGATKLQDELPYSIAFKSKIEADNFCKSFDTAFAKVYTHIMKRDVHVSPEIVLWLGNCINPRTGKKGYEGEWTNDDLYRFFNLTQDEIKTIEDTMKKYK